MTRGLPAQGDLRAIHPKYPRISTWSTVRRDHRAARQEPQFHQPPGHVVREVQIAQNGLLSFLKLSQSVRVDSGSSPVAVTRRLENELQHTLSM